MPPAPKVACRKCGTQIRKDKLKRHEDGCGKTAQPFVCSVCSKKYKTQPGLHVHFQKKHGTTETHPCSECDETFDTKDKLRNHFNQHHTDKFRCTCGNNHASTQNLNNHILQMAEQGNIGHEPKIKNIVIEPEKAPEVNKKRKAVEMDPVEKFFDAMRDKINRPDPTNPLCRSKKLCTTTRLSHGFPGGHKEYCSKHSDEVPGLVELGPLCKYVGCATRAHPFVVTTTGKLSFCAKHIKQLIRDGLPDPEGNISAIDYGKKCTKEGCDKRTSYDGGTYCESHSPTKISDDKRVCEESGCEVKRPVFGYPDMTPKWCGEHKKDGMFSHVLCSEPTCEKSASYGPPGGTYSSCVTHKKADYVLLYATICAMACCFTVAGGLQAVFFHPDHQDETSEFFGKRICRFGRRVLIEDALMHNDIVRLESLLTFFKMDRVLTLNAQSAFRFECESKYHKFLKDCVHIVFDDTVANGPKVIGALRPDIFYKWCVGGLNYGIHIEYDETARHEDDPRRLACIAENAECHDRVYVIRVEGGHDTKNPACERVHMENFEYFRVTGEGSKVASNVADAVVERIKWIEQGLGPCDDSRPSKIKF